MSMKYLFDFLQSTSFDATSNIQKDTLLLFFQSIIAESKYLLDIFMWNSSILI
ncbi:hypothetical protein MtrunA17_Chr6g0480281 [Medicago truncatula]|uniref:Uncharacterized protein n=1 Tax=Medicago truncatula TaxID=3880 RepID=A0A396HM57_MEDTR|nr:hypothetical protein MtrunA17_Chr6g0480281 [Medicago truncatula]